MAQRERVKGDVGKRFMYINRRPPHGSIFAHECLELVLVTAAFGQDQSVVFMDDGVFLLKKNQDPSAIGMKNFSRTYRALADHDVENIFVERESLLARGLTEADLIIPVSVVTSAQLREIMDVQDVVIGS